MPEEHSNAPGQKLRHAREALKLSQVDVARQLHLSLKIIAAIENDDYKFLVAPTYVRGYLRSYAKFLNLSAQDLQDLIASFEALEPLSIDKYSTTMDFKEKKIAYTYKIVRWTGYALIAALFVLAGVWTINRHNISIENIQVAPQLTIDNLHNQETTMNDL